MGGQGNARQGNGRQGNGRAREWEAREWEAREWEGKVDVALAVQTTYHHDWRYMVGGANRLAANPGCLGLHGGTAAADGGVVRGTAKLPLRVRDARAPSGTEVNGARVRLLRERQASPTLLRSVWEDGACISTHLGRFVLLGSTVGRHTLPLLVAPT